MNDSQSIRKRDRCKADTACKCVLTKRGDRAGTENSLQRFIILECACTDRSDRIPTQLLRQDNRRVTAGILRDRRLFGRDGIGIIILLADQAGNVERCRCDSRNLCAARLGGYFEIVIAEFITGFIEADDIDVPDCDILF